VPDPVIKVVCEPPPKSAKHLISESVREVGVLVLVFGILDHVNQHPSDIDWCWIATIIGISFILVGGSIFVDLKR